MGVDVSDSCEMTKTGKAKTKYRGLSTAAAKCAAFGRDDVVLLGVGRWATTGTTAGL